MKNQLIGLLVTGACGLCHAQGNDGTWASASSGNWTDEANWVDGIIADGATHTASFIVDFPNANELTVTPDAAQRVIGHIALSNLNENVTGTLTASSAGNTQHLVFDAGDTNAWSRIETGPGARFKTGAFAASNSVVKTGPGVLVLAHANNTALAKFANTLHIEEGQLIVAHNLGLTGMRLEIGGGDEDAELYTSWSGLGGNLGNSQSTGITSGARICVDSNGTGRVTFSGHSSHEIVTWNQWELGKTLTLSGGDNIGFGGKITGDGGLYVTGGSRVDLGHYQNTFGGGVTVSAGTLLVYNYGNALPGGCRVTLGDAQTGNASVRIIVNGNVSLGGDRTIYFADVGSTGNASVEFSSWPYNANATIGARVFADRDIIIKNGHTGAFNLTVSGLISGDGGVTYSSVFSKPNYLIMTATNTYAGGSVITNGHVIAQNLGRLGTGDVVIDGGAEADSAQLCYSPTTLANAALMNVIEDTANLHINNGGVIDFTRIANLGETARVAESVNTLTLDGRLMYPGTYGATGSGAKFVRDGLFVGAQGILNVTDGQIYGTTIVIQ